MTGPLCFVMLPFHAERDSSRKSVDFPSVYSLIIAPAIERAGMTPLRADEDPESRGVFQKSMFERLVLCEFAVADLTYGNPNVYYELGIRHALRPYSTVLLFREGWTLPLDLAHDSALQYSVNTEGRPTGVETVTQRLESSLRGARSARIDSPVYQLVTGLPVPEVDHARIDTFRDHADRDETLRRQLDSASDLGVEKVREVAASMGEAADLDLRAALALLLAFRSIEAFEDIVRLVESLSRPIAQVELISQQYVWALNRAGNDRMAERVAKELVGRRPSSESYGLLGRIMKDRWKNANASRRRGYLRAAIDAYVRGFETDWRDPYPGLNAVSLMSYSTPPDPRLEELLPIVEFANQRRLVDGAVEPDYWDHATDLGLAVLRRQIDRAHRALEALLASEHDPWQTKTTREGLFELAEAWSDHEDVTWIQSIIEELQGE